MSYDSRLVELGLELPPPPDPKGLYKPLAITGNLAYAAGHLPTAADGSIITGRLGAELDEDAGYRAARQAGLALLATLRKQLGTLDNVVRVVKVCGAVNSTPEFDRQPAVINGCSQLLADVFGQRAGVGARSAIGVASLPLGAAVEIEAVFEVKS